MPFGVELPENLGQQTSEENAPETKETELAPDQNDLGEASKPEATGNQRNAGLTDLEKLERFRFEGREWTPKDLRNAYLRHEDYTRKTQEVAEARKYADNFHHDLQTVLQSPERLAELKSIYPESYWKIAERILEEKGQKTNHQAANPESKAPALPREMQEILAWKHQVEQQQKEQRIQFIQGKLDQDFEKFGKKYPFAEEDTVNARALAYLDLNPKNVLTPKILESLFKQHHEQSKERYEKHYRGKVDEQKRAGFKAKDAGPGGSTPGTAPHRPKTIREATKLWESNLDAAR